MKRITNKRLTPAEIARTAEAWRLNAIWWRDRCRRFVIPGDRRAMRRSALMWRWIIEPKNRERIDQLTVATPL
jgi:hypothetical protein